MNASAQKKLGEDLRMQMQRLADLEREFEGAESEAPPRLRIEMENLRGIGKYCNSP